MGFFRSLGAITVPPRPLMKYLRIFLLLVAPIAILKAAEENWPVHPDSVEQQGVPKGEILAFVFDESEIFPGTSRQIWVYIPEQYDATKPACLYVCQDGIKYNAATVFDNLIHKNEMPVTIGVFAKHGRVLIDDPETQVDRLNRSFEYDTFHDLYALFLQKEILPKVESMRTGKDLPIRLSKRPTDRMIAGSSSGGVCAFSVAFTHPEFYSRVFTSVGTYVSMRGADQIPGLVRKFEPKPLRVFLQGGSNDNNLDVGDWWMGNQSMQRALSFSGYEVKHEWGDGGHNGKHATSLFPDAMRWLWKDWPAAPATHESRSGTLNDCIIRDEPWKLIGEGYGFTEGPIATPNGEVYFNDLKSSKTYHIDLEDNVTEWMNDTQRANGMAYAPNGKRYTLAAQAKEIWAFDAQGRKEVLAQGIRGNDIVVARNGNAYITEPPSRDNKRSDRSRVWLLRPNGEKVEVDHGLKFANGIALSPDQTQLYVADAQSKWIYSYMVQPDGALAHKQRLIWLHHKDAADYSGADGVRVDKIGRIWVATNMGIQICDSAGRSRAIIPTPNGRVANFCFAGPNFDTIYATCGDKVYKRKVKVTGVQSWQAPNKPAQPKT